ncbi:MAG: response regulator [Gammaproteobacteria bacterium]|nr:response regulator [Gammaproteobacteria bacterium]
MSDRSNGESEGEERANVLLVDDKPERLLTYEVILEPLGQNLVRANSGEEALAKLRGAEFAAILLDVSMPGMDGFETAQAIRTDPRASQTPIIFVTGVHITDLDRLRGYEMGAADYVYVPVVPEILRGKVQVLVQLHQQKRELARLNDRLAIANDELAQAHARLQAENTRELQKLNQTLEEANRQLMSEVAERKKAEALLRDAARRKDEYISILAHELRNPLAAMQSGIELLSGNPVHESRLKWSRDLLRRQLKHLRRLIDDLLDVSRITSGRVQLRRERLSLENVISHSLDAATPLIDEKAHRLFVDMPPHPLYVDGDPVRLTQVFGNLLTNAAKYTEEGGEISLTVDAAEASAGWVTVRVRDNGAGIPTDMLERVFELFTQADAQNSRSQMGLGIGLALARGLVELHGGTVHAVSDGPGKGAEFVVRLPLAGAASETAQPASLPDDAGAVASIGPLRLLIIDDNEDLARGLAMYLKETSGHEVRLAHTGQRGIAEALTFQPDAVLLDIGLPDIDGYEVARRLREQAGLREVPLIAITGFSSESDRKRAESAGFDRYFVKPVAYDVLSEVLSTQCAAAS